MIKFSLRSAGMTECLINFKYMVFGQPNQMDGKYCLSRRAGQSINFVLFVLVVASTAWLAPNITSVLLYHRSLWLNREIGGCVVFSSPQRKRGDKCFLLGASLCFTWGFHKSSTCSFPGTTKLLSIPAPLAPPVRPSSWPVFEAGAGAPPLGSLLRKAPHCVDETGPQPGPNSCCEVYKRLPFSPDIHKKDTLSKIQSYHLFSLSQSLSIPSAVSAWLILLFLCMLSCFYYFNFKYLHISTSCSKFLHHTTTPTSKVKLKDQHWICNIIYPLES